MALRYGSFSAGCSTPTVQYSQDSSLCIQSFAIKLGEVQIIDVSFNDGIGCSPCGTVTSAAELQIEEIGVISTSPKVKFSNGVLGVQIVKQGVGLSNHLHGLVKLAINATDFNLMPDEKYEISLSVRLVDGRVLSQSFFISLIHADVSGFNGHGVTRSGGYSSATRITGGVGIDVQTDYSCNEVSLNIAKLPPAP